jgi:hypothetical protein
MEHFLMHSFCLIFRERPVFGAVRERQRQVVLLFRQVPVCRAFTAATTSKDPIEFSMAYPKEGKVLPMIGLRTKLAPPLVAIKISRTEREYLFLLKAGATNQDNSFYGYHS